MNKDISKIKQTHGQLIKDESSILNDIFDKPKEKTSTASNKDVEKMTLRELQDVARELYIIPEDNKSSLLKVIKKELNKH